MWLCGMSLFIMVLFCDPAAAAPPRPCFFAIHSRSILVCCGRLCIYKMRLPSNNAWCQCLVVLLLILYNIHIYQSQEPIYNIHMCNTCKTPNISPYCTKPKYTIVYLTLADFNILIRRLYHLHINNLTLSQGQEGA